MLVNTGTNVNKWHLIVKCYHIIIWCYLYVIYLRTLHIKKMYIMYAIDWIL